MSLESLLKRDRRIVAAAIVALTALSWLYLLWLARSMAMPEMSMPEMPDMPEMAGMAGMDMSGVMAPMLREWSAMDYAFIFLMWAIMMVGMMTPSAAPMILIYAHVARHASQAELKSKPLAATGWFAGGYLLSWTGFSLAAALAQGMLERAAWLTPMMSAANSTVGGIVLLAAGVYQLTPLKEACLRQCQSPVAFIQSHGGFKWGALGSLRIGLQHGIYCIGCCWALMLVLFAVGIMNIAWIAAIAIFVLLEKYLPAGRVLARVAGVGLAGAGIWLLIRPL